jgi:hypothetical protein
MTPLGVTPAQIVAVTVRGFAQKSDAGSRTGAMQLKSGTAPVQQTTTGTTLTAGSWSWMWATYNNDPNTSAAWTAAGVNAINIGPVLLT